MFNLENLSPAEGSKKTRKRKGRGIGSGLGKTAGRGHKGQKSRSGGGVTPGFEGGQMPLARRLPKRGFYNRFSKAVAIVNVSELNRFEAGSVVDEKALAEAGLLRGNYDYVKVLGQGEIDRALTVKVDLASGSARAKIEAAGGSIEVSGG